eukprot:120507-Pyramimonas_sp.AAC.1
MAVGFLGAHLMILVMGGTFSAQGALSWLLFGRAGGRGLSADAASHARAESRACGRRGAWQRAGPAC